MVKNLPAMQETWVWPLGQEDPLEKGMATHSSVLAWKADKALITWLPRWCSGKESACQWQETQEMQVQSPGPEDPLEKDMAASLQYSCLESFMDRGAWWATVPEVAQSQTWENTQHKLTGVSKPSSCHISPFTSLVWGFKHLISHICTSEVDQTISDLENVSTTPYQKSLILHISPTLQWPEMEKNTYITDGL